MCVNDIRQLLPIQIHTYVIKNLYLQKKEMEKTETEREGDDYRQMRMMRSTMWTGFNMVIMMIMTMMIKMMMMIKIIMMMM